jgi:UDP-glucuronate decarboxylase
VSDLVEGILRLFLRAPADDAHLPTNIGNPTEFTVRELAELVVELTGATSTLDVRPLPQDDPKQRQPDLTRARATLGWTPSVALRDGLARTIAYFRGRLTDDVSASARLLPGTT